MGTSEFNAGGNPAMDWHPIQGGVEIFLVALCHRNRDKLRSDGPLGSYADFTLPYFGGRRGGLMVSALDFRASSPGSSPGRGQCVVFLGKTLYSHSASLSTQVYKWVPAICWANLTKLRGSDLRWTSIPSRGSRNTSSRFMLQKPG